MFFEAILKKIFGSANDRYLKRIQPLVQKINALESSIKPLSDEGLRSKTTEFKERLSKGESLDSLLPEAFAVVREAAMRTLKQRHYDVQLIGGIVLHQGKIAEMKTGEGKTLVATLPVYLNALTGKGVHVITVNDYLARRDATWMGPIYTMLGLTVGVIVHGLNDQERQAAYNSDVTYGTNNEFGFDYLRDNMKFRMEDLAQRPLHYCIVDEVDSILVDEARTPLIISGPAEESTDKYYKINALIPGLSATTDYTLDEKSKSAALTEEGVTKVEKRLGLENLYDPRNIELVHHVNQALRAHAMFKCDVDYVVKEGEVIIVDEFTGRLMPGRRYSDGLHQALEAKEGVKVANENQTLATITFQNYFRMYEKLAGMTGTADTEAVEFKKIYNLDVAVIPTNKPMIREDFSDVIYKTEKAKFHAVIQEIKERYEKQMPVLVGTISIEKSEVLASMLKRQGVPHHVLNAKHHEKEAEIIAQAGQPGAITIATNMAGRGTDIVLGEGVAKKGGLRIIGTERHESRRIDNQLRGRSGRQGDPGSSRFYLSLEDDLMRIFGSERISKVMSTLGMKEDEPIEHRWITKAVENAQKRVEGHNFEIRKHLLDFDNVMNLQREAIYGMRRTVMQGENIRDIVTEMLHEVSEETALSFVGNENIKDDEFDWKGLEDVFYQQFGFRLNLTASTHPSTKQDALAKFIEEKSKQFYEEKEKKYTPEFMRHVERILLLETIDFYWKDHLLGIDHMREGINLRAYAQKDPILEYKKEAFQMFKGMMFQIKATSLSKIFRAQGLTQEEVLEIRQKQAQELAFIHGNLGRDKAEAPKPVTRVQEKVGRNDPCPCGSGKKYKKCCGNKL
ncbi:MAG: preprotein translocase subunit SecA [Deltaproteobacteria bacterium GWA2_38_16]|nr:MAG: preprotein translocase subunit SecA [Deltaproteobacteria bacterium GWA2_38_16]OGQ02041.1 MAG: preprotein translocase subunit SecA [Deltaproteobacteria bacterium RIFCSPHIGHO2_02_FULL_38_15]OGQ33302.1 MAG: preprotein translocase subunit SecA [Deltaproteobacteria bacterium RIFCSPLOWO2_01_FULL_38_9]HBQ21576.1 preprotein translocase subunit SecA [Deltaproteobacteria bacterium]